jgi:ABC-type branched-subunit amino acid transport system ATPase component
VAAGSILTIIGPNGAGKSTLIKTVAGVVRRRVGSIRIDGAEIGGLSASAVAREGLAFVPQEANVFRTLTVVENLEMGAWIDRPSFRERMAKVFELFPALEPLRGVRAGNLSGGQRQMVAFGMAMMVEPRMLLLDEPSAGLSPTMVQTMFDAVLRVNRRGIAILMVEQNAIQALRMSDHGLVMAAGQVAMSAPAAKLLESRDVSELYLGVQV